MDPTNVQGQLKQAQHDAKRRMALAEKNTTGQELTPAEAEELRAIEARWRQALDARHRLREAQFAEFPPLPPALPEVPGWDGKKESSFCLWCRGGGGQVEVVRQYLEEHEVDKVELMSPGCQCFISWLKICQLDINRHP